MKIYDISEPISPETAVFPGDTPFTAEWVARIGEGIPCNVSTIRMSAHCGTHTDSPFHLDNAGLDMASVELTAYLGPCRVIRIDVEGDPALIHAAGLLAKLKGAERVLFKTSDSHDHKIFNKGFPAVGGEAAEVLVTAGIKLVGIDTPSMDWSGSKDLPGHISLNRGGIAILENLDLSAVEPGDYELIALPLKIAGSDSSPVRAILRELL